MPGQYRFFHESESLGVSVQFWNPGAMQGAEGPS